MTTRGMVRKILTEPERQISHSRVRRLSSYLRVNSGRRRQILLRSLDQNPCLCLVRRALFLPNVSDPIHDCVPELRRANVAGLSRFVKEGEGLVSARSSIQFDGDLINDVRP